MKYLILCLLIFIAVSSYYNTILLVCIANHSGVTKEEFHNTSKFLK